MTDIFVDATVNQASADYRHFGGNLMVEIFGTLDGANVETWIKASPKSQPARLRKCSWITGEDTLVGAGVGVQPIPRSGTVFFTITNVGTSTDINLSANVGEIS